LLGAAYVEYCQYFLRDALRLLATGGGLLLLLMVAPGGIGELVYNVRDRVLRALARAKGLSVPSLAEHPDFDAGAAPALGGAPAAAAAADRATRGTALVTCEAIDAAYGQIQVLFDVDAHVDDGEIVALL